MSEPVARLIEQRQGRSPQIHELDIGTHVIGRARGVDVLIDHADVSRRHAELVVTAEGATIRDLDSKNGVAVDGRKLAEATLDDGSRLAFGELELVLEHPGARVDRVLALGGEPTVRRPRPAAPNERAPTVERSVIVPAIFALVFGVLIVLLLVFG